MTEVQSDLTHDTVTASATVAASPAEVFDFLRRPANHAVITGDHTVKGATKGPEVLDAGSKFGMSMKLGVPYRITSKVVEFEPDRRLTWRHPLGHVWSWEVEPAADGGCVVTETFDLSKAKGTVFLRLYGYPAKHTDNVKASVANVVAHFAAS